MRFIPSWLTGRPAVPVLRATGPRLRAGLIAALAAACLVPVGLSTASASAAAGPLRYVALGDSYSAASGNLPYDVSSPLCLRSTVNYPHIIASVAKAQLTDVTCGDATTSNYFTSQYPSVAPQLDALSPNTQLVTMTIGGNDSNVFIDTVLECTADGVKSLGQGDPCKQQYGASFVDTINDSTYPNLVKALTAVRQAAPRARLAIIGYPEIMPPTGGCFPQMPIATGDVPYVYGIEAALNSAVKRAAAKTGATYVNMTKVSTGHDACKAVGVRWIEPVLFGTNPVIVHPNEIGEAAMAAQTEAVLHLS